MLRRTCVLALILLGWSTLLPAALVEGTDYTLLRPALPGDSPGKIEVIQFFSYGCPHCATMHPMLDKWAAKLPKDVTFKRVPVSFGRPMWASLAKTFYAIESTGDLNRLDGPLFNAIHQENKQLTNEQTITSWMGTRGADPGKFSAAYNSFFVNSKIGRAEELTKEYHVDAVPYFTVDGRYVVIGRTYEQMLDVTNQLIAKARKEHQKR